MKPMTGKQGIRGRNTTHTRVLHDRPLLRRTALALLMVLGAGSPMFGLVHAPAQANDLFPSESTGLELGWNDVSTVSDLDLARNSGGADINVGDIGMNIANNTATMTDNTVDGTVTTGGIAENTLNDVSGINALMYNTGNNVNFQSNMQVNIFLK